MASWAAYDQTPGYLQKQPCHLPEKRQVYNFSVLPTMTYGAETWTLTKQAPVERKCGRTDQNVMKYAQHTYRDRKTNIWVWERTNVIDIISNVRKIKWSWAGHIKHLKDDRWTSRVTTWRPYDKKILQW